MKANNAQEGAASRKEKLFGGSEAQEGIIFFYAMSCEDEQGSGGSSVSEGEMFGGNDAHKRAIFVLFTRYHLKACFGRECWRWSPGESNQALY